MPEQHRSAGPIRRGLDAAYIARALGTPAFTDGLAEWRQGDLIRDIGLFWAGTEDDPLTGLQVPVSPGHRWPVVAWDGVAARPADEPAATAADQPDGPPLVPEWGIITSQTCDVVATGPGARHPTVQVSPLLDLTGADPNKVTGIRRHMNVDLAPVSTVPGGGSWAADLRISLPVSKAVLLQQERHHGFDDPAGAHAFAERVAGKFRRAALHDQLSVGLAAGLEQAVKQAKKAGAVWPDEIEQFRLLVTRGDRLHPKNVAVLAVTLADKLSPEEMEPLRKWRNQERRRLLRVSDIQLDPVRFRSVDRVGARDYRASDWLRITELGQQTFW